MTRRESPGTVTFGVLAQRWVEAMLATSLDLTPAGLVELYGDEGAQRASTALFDAYHDLFVLGVPDDPGRLERGQ